MQLKKFKKLAMTMFLCVDMVAATVPVHTLAAQENTCQNVTDEIEAKQGEENTTEEDLTEEATEETDLDATVEETTEENTEDVEEVTNEEEEKTEVEEAAEEKEAEEAETTDVVDTEDKDTETTDVEEVNDKEAETADVKDAEDADSEEDTDQDEEGKATNDSLMEAIKRAKAATTDEEIISDLEELEALCLLPNGMYAQGQVNGYHWVIDSGFKFSAIPDTTGTCNFSTAGWEQYKAVIKEVDINVPFSSNLDSLFEGCVNLEKAKIKIDRTSGSADYMFADCSKLKTLDLAGFNSTGVTSMKRMFANCTVLDGLDLSKVDTTNVKDMSFMFLNCEALKGFNIGGLKTSNVVYMNKMFAGCSSLAELNVSGLDTVNVVDMSDMFQNCSKLMTLNLAGFRTAKVTDMSKMFSGCSSLKALDIGSLNTSSVTDMSGMFEGCSSLPKAILRNFTTPNVVDMRDMFAGCTSLTQVDLYGFTNEKLEYAGRMFLGCSNLSSVDLSRFKTPYVKDMSSMFEGCAKLSKPDVSSFTTINVTDMSRMFYGCSSATKIDVSSFNTTKVENAEQMFTNCSSLKTLDLSNFNFSKLQGVYHTSDLVVGCNALTSIRSPKNIPLNYTLPSNGNWYRDDTKEIVTAMPTFQGKSITLVREAFKLLDVPTTDWKYSAVRYMVDRGIMNGTEKMATGDIKFTPDGLLTRAQFVQTLYNFEKTPVVTYESRFADVPNGEWYTAAVIWAFKNGITSGVSANNFGKDMAITRQEMITMLYKYAVNVKKCDVSKKAAINGFSDYLLTDSWAVEGLQWATANGVISGKTGVNNTKLLDPKGTATRAECAAMIRNFLQVYGY